MLFMVEMIVQIPHSLDPALVAQIKQDEKEYSQKLQREGKWRHIWRVVGEYANGDHTGPLADGVLERPSVGNLQTFHV